MEMTYLSVFLTFFAFLILSSSAASIASDQLKFWSQNVHNKMPSSITKKLTPLTQKDTEIFSNNMIFKNNNEFTTDAKFCTLAHLACSSVFDTSKALSSNSYSSNTYSVNSVGVRSEKTKDDPFSFFRLSILKIGNNIHLPNLEDSMPDRAFLPSTIASKIPLTNKLFKIFGSSSKTMKENIDTALSYCNADAIQGEVKSCAKSLEEMILFSKSALGGKKLVSLSSKSTRGSNSATKVSTVKKISTDKIVACHEVFLPFAMYFCHSIPSTNLYVVDLVDVKSGAPINTMLAICHMDTSPWPANHVAFRILNFGPGQGEACHWFTQLDLAWVAKE